MDWFKFYGKDWLTDLKIIRMPIEDRLCFITLLCLSSASEDGVVRKCDENSLIELTHLHDNPYDDDNEYNRALGILKRLSDKGMITIDNDSDVTVVNFSKRQSRALTSYERVKRYREKQKMANNINISNDNEMITDDNANDNAREDKIRQDKILSKTKVSQIINNKKSMKKNSFNYSESKHSDSYEDEVDIETGEVIKPKSTKKYPNAKIIFDLFGKYPANWKINTTQLKSAENLFTERGVDQVMKALKFLQENKENKFCPEVYSPYDLDSKWAKTISFKKKLQ